jgi:GNAT superfamily N-acetyltransferase
MTSTPSTTELVTVGAPIALRDGSRVRVPQGHRSDRELLLRGFERLSAESRYRRFLAPMPHLTEGMIRYLTEIDHRDHEAVIALVKQSGEGIGVARYVRHPDRPEVAELAVTVIDDWQGRGLGTVLLGLISARAREEGITAFTALILATNQEMIDLLGRLAPVRIVDRETGRVEVEVPIPTIGVAPALRKLLQIAARTDGTAPLPGRERGSTGRDRRRRRPVARHARSHLGVCTDARPPRAQDDAPIRAGTERGTDAVWHNATGQLPRKDGR